LNNISIRYSPDGCVAYCDRLLHQSPESFCLIQKLGIGVELHYLEELVVGTSAEVSRKGEEEFDPDNTYHAANLSKYCFRTQHLANYRIEVGKSGWTCQIFKTPRANRKLEISARSFCWTEGLRDNS
jgi:hypothetical protein